MATTYYNGPPGIEAARTATHRALFLQRSETFLAQGRIIAGACTRDTGNADVGVIRAGMPMGIISSVVNSLGAVGSYANSILGVTTGAIAIGATSISVAAAVVTELVRRVGSSGTFKLVGPAAANGVAISETITYSAASGTTITVTATANAFVAGSFVCPTDGSADPVTMTPDWDYGINMLDQDGASVTAVPFAKVPVSGIVDSSQLIFWPSDTGLQAWLIARLNDVAGGQFVFDNRY